MKKIVVFLTAALVVSVCSTGTLASCHGHGGHHWDGHGAGICNNRGSHGCGGECSGYIDGNGDGICDNKRYDIKYYLNGGKNSKKNPTCYCQAAKTIKLANPARNGYTFKGWYADRQCKKKVTVIKKWSVGKKTLYAKWKKN